VAAASSFWLAVQALIVRGLWRGGRIAWVMAFLWAVTAPVFVALVGGLRDTGTTAFILVSAAQAAVLALMFVSGRRAVAPSS
jgi:hypothetical protein